MQNYWKGALAAAVVAIAAASMPVQAADETVCGTDRTIDIAEMSWPSAAALARIHGYILENGYGCNVEIVSGATAGVPRASIDDDVGTVSPLTISTLQQ